MSNFIEKIEVNGLHGRFDLRLERQFKSGINILYGKNGTGKTTLLHILANALNGDYKRFVYIAFDEIDIKLGNGFGVKISQERTGDDTSVSVSTNEGNFEFAQEKFQYSRLEIEEEEVEKSAILDGKMSRQMRLFELEEETQATGGLLSVAYFPAFRTMIEAWAAQRSKNERVGYGRGLDPYIRNVQLTRFSRNFFGNFIPQLTYTSTLEIEWELSASIEQAQLEMGRKDRDFLSQTFLEILPALSRSEQVKVADTDDPNEVLEEIRALLENLENSRFEQEIASAAGIYTKLRALIRSFQVERDTEDVAVRILNVYKEILQSRLTEQARVFEPTKIYLDSVNEFLEGKKLVTTRRPVRTTSFGRRRLIGVKFDDGSSASLRTLSSGERQVLALIYAATQMSKQQVVLIDEPEISLHVDWQRELLRRMSAQLSNRQIIACTHSPIIGADYENHMQELYLTPSDKAVSPLFNDEEDLE